MGHNLVISKTADMQAIATEGMSQGLDKDYIKADNAAIIGHTKMIGAGEKASISLDIPSWKPVATTVSSAPSRATSR